VKALRTRLGSHLLLVALVAIAPVIVGIVVTQSMARGRARERTLSDSLRLVRLAANEQAGVFDGARRLLLTLAEFPPMRAKDPGACQEMLPNVLHAHPGFLTLAVANTDGTLFCSAAPPSRRTLGNATGRAWFDRVMASRTTATGDFQISAATGKPAIVVAHPLFDSTGGVSRILIATIDLDRLSSVASGAELPAGGTLTLFDRSRTILARFPSGGSWVGRQVPDARPVERLVAGASEDVTETAGVDGVRRLYVTVPVRASVETNLYVGMGIDRDAAFLESDRIHYAYLSLLAIVSLLGLGTALIGGHVFVLRPVKALKKVTDRIAGGDLSARAQLASGVASIGGLGDAVNAMAGALDVREHERERAERELRESEDRYRLLFEQNPHPMWVYDETTLGFLEVNEAAVQRYGYSRSEFLAMRISDIGRDHPGRPLAAGLTAAHGPREELDGRRHHLKSGEIIDVEVASHGVIFAGRRAVVITAQDITARTRAEAALAERAALTTASAEVGVALNRPGDLGVGLQSCAEAIVAHLDLAAVKIWVIQSSTGLLELEGTAGDGCEGDDADERLKAGAPTIARIAQERRRHVAEDLANDPTVYDRDWAVREGLAVFASWPLVVGDRVVGVLALFARTPLSEGALAGLTSVAALISLGITRHQSEDARRLLAAIVASSDDAIFGATIDGTIASWNTGAHKLFGYAEEEIIGRPASLLHPADLGSQNQVLLAASNRGEHVTNRETVRRRKDGSLVPVSLTLSPIKDAAGGVIGISAIVRDITERRRAEERIQLLARAVESTNEMVCVTDTDDRITFVNAAFLRAYGYTADEVIGQTAALMRSSHTADALIQEIARASRSEGWKGEVLNRRRDGSEFYVSLNTSAVRDDRGEIIGLLGVARDISERLGAELALRDAEERMRFALEASHVGVWEANLKTGVAFFSETCEIMHGLARGTFGRTYEAFVERIHPEDRAAALERIDKAIGNHERAELEYRTRWPDNTERRISTVAHFSFDGDGKAVRAAGVAVDVTERRSLEDQLRQSQKMDAVGQLAGGIAHDFNNLLTVIQGFAGFLAESLPEPDERHADVMEIVHAANRAAALTRQLLAFSRKQLLAVRVLHIGDIVGELTPMLRRLLGESIDLRTMVGDRGLAKIDPGQLHQVIINLAVNARDAMPHGGQLTVETSDIMLDDAFARLHPSVRPGPHVLIAVTDTGCGMDAETQKRIFEPFFTTKPMGQGTGLGLATVYGIVKQSDASIWVESQIGHGTTFKVYLPRTNEVEEPRPLAIETRALGGAETVLLVEDEDVVRDFVYKVLSRSGYNVHAVGDPGKALEYARAQDAAIDLVFSDVILPNMSGPAMMRQMRQAHPEARVLYMSGYTGHAIVHQGVLEAGTEFLQKPFTAATLSRKVRDVLDA
jgi:two-component system, cell cycle sensor histidine kinase and response regulator CckA